MAPTKLIAHSLPSDWNSLIRHPSNVASAQEFLNVLRRGKHPQHIFMMLMRNNARLCGMWPMRKSAETSVYYWSNVTIMSLLIFFILIVTLPLADADINFVSLGEISVLLGGIYLVNFKIWMSRQNTSQIDEILHEINDLHHRLSQPRDSSAEVRRMQRLFFLCEGFITISFSTIALALLTALCIQPLFTNQPLPITVKLPLLQSLLALPLIHICLYTFESVCLAFHLWAIISLDTIACNIILHTALLLKILATLLREFKRCDEHSGQERHLSVPIALRGFIKLHQQIINLVEKVNNLYYTNYLVQMVASTFVICLTAFETTLARDQPVVALKFAMYMMASFVHLFYWCFVGNFVYYESMQVANAGFELHGWFDESPALQRNLMFLIQRAQKPLIFRPRPIFGFTIESFTSILSTSYSYFALLQNMTQ